MLIRLNPDQQKSRVAFLMANSQQMIPLRANHEEWPESDMDSSNLYLCQKRVREEGGGGGERGRGGGGKGGRRGGQSVTWIGGRVGPYASDMINTFVET